MKYNYILFLLLALFPLHQSKAQCPTLSATITPVACTNGATGAIALSVSGDTANVSNPGLLISEIQTDPALADSPKEWVELIATRSINFARTPYTVIFSNNGMATSKGFFLDQEAIGVYSLQANGAYNRSIGVYSTPRTWTTNTSALASASSGITVSSNTYFQWSN